MLVRGNSDILQDFRILPIHINYTRHTTVCQNSLASAHLTRDVRVHAHVPLTEKIDKFPRESPLLCIKFSRESPKFWIGFHGTKRESPWAVYGTRRRSDWKDLDLKIILFHHIIRGLPFCSVKTNLKFWDSRENLIESNGDSRGNVSKFWQS